jgi:hypothetical protein
MFSLDGFYFALNENLLLPLKLNFYYLYPHGATSPESKMSLSSNGYPDTLGISVGTGLMYDQEPLINFVKDQYHDMFFPGTPNFLTTSELSSYKTKICDDNDMLDWYFFFHGFATLFWYQDYKYVPHVEHKFDKVFMCMNRLVTQDRSYRLLLVSLLLEQGLVSHGHVSLSLHDHGHGTWQQEILDPATRLSTWAVSKVSQHIGELSGSLVIDQDFPLGPMSASSGQNELRVNHSALWHVVTETVFYHLKLHLTEKIFKPMVSHRPFILVAAPGNLAYLRGYGFKTFGRWIDESYDSIDDPDLRIQAVVKQVQRLCELTPEQQQQMYFEMQETLEHNFNHFYGKFREIITDELLDNFSTCAHTWNQKNPHRPILLDQVDLGSVKQILMQ